MTLDPLSASSISNRLLAKQTESEKEIKRKLNQLFHRGLCLSQISRENLNITKEITNSNQDVWTGIDPIPFTTGSRTRIRNSVNAIIQRLYIINSLLSEENYMASDLRWMIRDIVKRSCYKPATRKELAHNLMMSMALSTRAHNRQIQLILSEIIISLASIDLYDNNHHRIKFTREG